MKTSRNRKHSLCSSCVFFNEYKTKAWAGHYYCTASKIHEDVQTSVKDNSIWPFKLLEAASVIDCNVYTKHDPKKQEETHDRD